MLARTGEMEPTCGQCRSKPDSVRHASRTKKEETTKPAGPAVPSADPSMYAGILGAIVDAARPTTEADPVGIYASLLAGTGVIIGAGLTSRREHQAPAADLAPAAGAHRIRPQG